MLVTNEPHLSRSFKHHANDAVHSSSLPTVLCLLIVIPARCWPESMVGLLLQLLNPRSSLNIGGSGFSHPRASYFFSTARKSNQKVPPQTNLPCGNLNFQLCQRVGWISVHADQPRFAVHGKSPLPKLKIEAGCVGGKTLVHTKALC